MARLLKNFFCRVLREDRQRQTLPPVPLRAHPRPRVHVLRERIIRDTETYLQANLRREPAWPGRHPVQDHRSRPTEGSTFPGAHA